MNDYKIRVSLTNGKQIIVPGPLTVIKNKVLIQSSGVIAKNLLLIELIELINQKGIVVFREKVCLTLWPGDKYIFQIQLEGD